ncbi:MAG: hypothetical protein GF341_03595, partial [candidate division Zixibacteria bacterium]|nr:hypothetical protein [candidate division Zixibacteria bacterium]
MTRKIGSTVTRLCAAVLLTAGCWTVSHAQDVIIDIDDVEPGELQSAAFELKSRGDIQVIAIGAEHERGEAMFAYPWIIDAASRELVWSMDEEFTEAVDDNEWLRRFDDDIDLKPGVYEVYYYANRPYYFDGYHFDFGNIDLGNEKDNEKFNQELEDLLDALGKWMKNEKHDLSNDELRYLIRKLGIEIRSDGNVSTVAMGTGRLEPDIDLTRPRNDAYLSQAFALDEEAELELYGIGEFYKSEDIMVDWGWIIDARTREQVWE